MRNIGRHHPAKLCTVIDRAERLHSVLDLGVVVGMCLWQPGHHHGVEIAAAYALVKWRDIGLHQFNLLAKLVRDQLGGELRDELGV